MTLSYSFSYFPSIFNNFSFKIEFVRHFEILTKRQIVLNKYA